MDELEEIARETQGSWPFNNLIGKNPDRPFRICALNLHRTLGDFVESCIFAASVKQLFDFAKLSILYRDDRVFKSPLMKLMPNLDHSWMVPGDALIPLEAFDFAGAKLIQFQSESWRKSDGEIPDLVLTPSMMKRESLPAFECLARLEFPQELAVREEARLRSTGLSPDRWFCVLHYRDTNEFRYEHSIPRPNRDLAIEKVVPVVEHVIKALGGQVVRVGHREMAPLPEIDGFFDISGIESPILLHAYAISRSRFFLELSPSGAYAIALGFGVPIARCGNVATYGPVDEQSIVLPKHVVGPNNKRVCTEKLSRLGLFDENIIESKLKARGYRFAENSIAEFKKAAEQIFENTADTPGWRESRPTPNPTTLNNFVLPMKARTRHTVVEYPDLAPNFGE